MHNRTLSRVWILLLGVSVHVALWRRGRLWACVLRLCAECSQTGRRAHQFGCKAGRCCKSGMDVYNKRLNSHTARCGRHGCKCSCGVGKSRAPLILDTSPRWLSRAAIFTMISPFAVTGTLPVHGEGSFYSGQWWEQNAVQGEIRITNLTEQDEVPLHAPHAVLKLSESQWI